MPGIALSGQGDVLPLAVVEDRGVVVAGARTVVHVFQAFSRQRLWFSVTARASFAGYAVSAGVLYLQDGPVLSAWDLTTATVTPDTHQASGVCLAAVNLVTGSMSGPEPVTDDQYAALFAGASETGFSAPVVRAQQMEGPAAFMVFVLAADGSVYAADDALDNVTTTRYDTPGPLSLAIAETADPNDPGQVTCTLAYVTDNGGIMVLDTSRDAPAPAGSWPSSGSGPAAVAGPRIDGGVVWACDVFGAAIAACPLPTPTPPVFVAPGWNPARAALSFEVSSARQLVLLSGIQQRLLAFAPGTKVVDRWGPRNDAVPSWTLFWEADSDRAAEPGLILEVEQAATAGNAALSIYVANTVDPPQPQLAAHYPPPPTALATYPLSLAPYAKGRVSAVLARPVMAQRQLFTLVADDKGNASLGAWPLEAICKAALPAAAVELQRLALLVEPIRLKVQTLHHILLQSGDDISVPRTADPNRAIGVPGIEDEQEFAAVTDTLTLTVGAVVIEITTDAGGWVTLDAQYHGQRASASYRGHSGSAQLSTESVLTIDFGATWGPEYGFGGNELDPPRDPWNRIRRDFRKR